MTTTQRVERRISAVASVTLCLCTVAVQILLSLALVYFLREYAGIIYGALWFVGFCVAMWVYLRTGNASYKLAWMTLLLALPVSGLILFCLWGGIRQKRQLSMKNVTQPPQSQANKMWSKLNIQRLSTTSWGRLATYLAKRDFPVFANTKTHYFSDGSDYFDDLIEKISQAQVYVFLEYYILAEGQIWNRLFAALEERASQGVEVRIIFDDFGNITRLSDAMLQKMQDAAMEVEVFNPVHRYVNRIYFNYRDHRKIAVVDGYYAYTGGINVGDEYANLQARYGHWKDSAVRLEGAGAWGLARQFIQMWNMLGKQLSNEDDFYRPRMETTATGYCQPFCDGPLHKPDSPVEDTYLQLINGAKRFLYITTPYYAVEEGVQSALCIAADSGVDVRLMVPAIPDHPYPYMVAETYWGELLRHGVKIYKYIPGFLHAKSVMVDREVALIGSTNMDYRTFHLHYECGVVFYQSPVVEQLLEDMDTIMGESAPYTLSDWQARPALRRWFASFLRLFAIWL